MNVVIEGRDGRVLVEAEEGARVGRQRPVGVVELTVESGGRSVSVLLGLEASQELVRGVMRAAVLSAIVPGEGPLPYLFPWNTGGVAAPASSESVNDPVEPSLPWNIGPAVGPGPVAPAAAEGEVGSPEPVADPNVEPDPASGDVAEFRAYLPVPEVPPKA
jgi:hypothetical protein